MAIVLNFETQQVEHDVSSPQQTPPNSSQGENGRNRDGGKRIAVVDIQNVEEAPPSGENTQPPLASSDASQQLGREFYSRHSQHQIQEMESLFKVCPHPNEMQKRDLSNLIGLNSMQIQFWFQNKRTQMRSMLKRQENTLLIAENEKLHAENLMYKEALINAKCVCCGGPTSVHEMSFEKMKLRLENAQLKEKIENLRAMAAKYVGKPAGTCFSNLPPPPHAPTP